VKTDRTELQWTCAPTDFFEEPYDYAASDFNLSIRDERVIAILTTPRDPVPKLIEHDITSLVTATFQVRQLQSHRAYSLRGPTIYQYSGGRRSIAVGTEGTSLTVSVGRGDVIVRDAAGNVVQDSKAERKYRDLVMLDQVAPKIVKSPPLQNMVASYARAVEDPANELIHLYEIRDALTHHYLGERRAQKALRISNSQWKRLGILANVEPLAQSRHRGKHQAENRRPATERELEEARSLAREWIEKFAGTL
jgi:hypothetical protein